MLSKIFISVLLLTCVYTYMLESVKDKNDTNFQKLPDNSNFELNGIQTVKPNLKNIGIAVYNFYLLPIFGISVVEKIHEHFQDIKV